jgi:Fe-S cluster biogenesis protein NfuA
MLNDAWGQQPTTFKDLPALRALPKEPEGDRAATSPFKFAKEVESALDKYVRPLLKKDGGDLELLDIKDNMLYIRLQGTCSGCAHSGQTMKMMVERTLKEMVDDKIVVITVQ